MSVTESFAALREAISAPRSGDDAPQDDQIARRRKPLIRGFLDLLPRWPQGSESIFTVPLTRQVSGWGALIGAVVGGLWTWDSGIWTLAAAILGGIMGSIGLVASLVALAAALAAVGPAWTLVLGAGLAVIVHWALTPW